MNALALFPVELGNNGVVADMDIVDKVAVGVENGDAVRRSRRGVGKKRQHAEKGEKQPRRQETAYLLDSTAHHRLIHA